MRGGNSSQPIQLYPKLLIYLTSECKLAHLGQMTFTHIDIFRYQQLCWGQCWVTHVWRWLAPKGKFHFLNSETVFARWLFRQNPCCILEYAGVMGSDLVFYVGDASSLTLHRHLQAANRWDGSYHTNLRSLLASPALIQESHSCKFIRVTDQWNMKWKKNSK